MEWLQGIRMAVLLMVSTTMLLAQGKASLDADKAKIAVLSFDAVKITEQYGFKQSVNWNKNSVTYQQSAESPFADAGAITAFAEAATQRTVEAFVKTGRFTVLDRTAMEKVMKEQDFQMSDNVDPNSASKIGALLGAQYIVNGQIQNVSTNPVYDRKNTSKLLGYSGTVEIQITLIDVSTGQVTSSKRLKGSTEVEGTKVFGISLLDIYESTPSKAAYKGLGEIGSDMKKWLKDAFPVEGKIVEIQKTDKKKGATRVLISCGKNLGVSKDDAFKVIQEVEVDVDGKMYTRQKEVGRIVVKAVEEDGIFSICDIEKGGDTIKKEIDKGGKLKVVSTKK